MYSGHVDDWKRFSRDGHSGFFGHTDRACCKRNQTAREATCREHTARLASNGLCWHMVPKHWDCLVAGTLKTLAEIGGGGGGSHLSARTCLTKEPQTVKQPRLCNRLDSNARHLSVQQPNAGLVSLEAPSPPA